MQSKSEKFVLIVGFVHVTVVVKFLSPIFGGIRWIWIDLDGGDVEITSTKCWSPQFSYVCDNGENILMLHSI